MSKWINKPKDYWKDWYWNKGGREKVQHSRHITQPLLWENQKQKDKQNGRV